MIAPADEIADTIPNALPTVALLARYGAVPQVARFTAAEAYRRSDQIVAETDRGLEIATVLERIPVSDDVPYTGRVLRRVCADDLLTAARWQQQSAAEFVRWQSRVTEWKLELVLVDLEQTLDGKLVLYVLNDRNAETTRFALLAAANGLGIVHIQPVSSEGIVFESGGCGSGGCGSGGCGH